MIKRYWSPTMRMLWETPERKFHWWLEVEIAAIGAREALGQIPDGTARNVRERTWMDPIVMNAIVRRDKEINHDLNAFVEIIRLQLILPREEFDRLPFGVQSEGAFNEAIDAALAKQSDSPLAGYFHDGMTSYDTEEPAMALLLRESGTCIQTGLSGLCVALKKRAQQHRGTLMIGRTHGQHAQPITFGIKLVNWCSHVDHALQTLDQMMREIGAMKLSGAVGTYGTLSPDVEDLVAKSFGLTPVIATQIVPLDRRARLLNELAVIGAVLENIAFDLWLMAQTEVGEIREPFGKRQKGSSAMPHKKNPITLEKLRGLPRLLRGYAMAGMENVATANERDISHSSVERFCFADAFGVLDHVITQLTKIIDGMEVFPERMLQNLKMTHGVIASQRVEMWLKSNGVPAEAAYRAVQRLCAEAVENRRFLGDLILSDSGIRALLGTDFKGALDCFDWKSWVEHEDFIYQRAGIGDTPT